MFAYDSASSASSSSPPPLTHRLRRHPSRHVSPRPYSPASREADIARLLDPAYTSPASNSPLSKSRMLLKEVYVDHHGDFHDPDFRDFPPFGPSHPRRPQWERDYQEEEDEEEEDACEPEQHRPSLDLQRRRPSSSITFHPPPVYYFYEEPSSSYESRYLAEDDLEEVDQLERTPLKEKSFCCRSRSPTKRPKSQDEKQSPTSDGDRVIQADSEWTPTCTQNLRRHWQAITLSLRFSLFRTKRRLRRRLTG